MAMIIALRSIVLSTRVDINRRHDDRVHVYQRRLCAGRVHRIADGRRGTPNPSRAGCDCGRGDSHTRFECAPQRYRTIERTTAATVRRIVVVGRTDGRTDAVAQSGGEGQARRYDGRIDSRIDVATIEGQRTIEIVKVNISLHGNKMIIQIIRTM